MGTVGEMPNFFDYGSKTKALSLLIEFSSKLLILCEWKSKKEFTPEKEKIAHIALL